MSPRLKPSAFAAPLGLLAALLLGACATPSDLPPLDVSGPDWRLWQGQSVWENRFSDNALIGEFVAGVSQAQGVRFAELTKGGMPIVRARRTAEKWEVQFPTQNLAQRGQGDKVPAKWIFLHLPEILAGDAPPEGWVIERKPESVILSNAELRERLELQLQESS